MLGKWKSKQKRQTALRQRRKNKLAERRFDERDAERDEKQKFLQ